VKEIDDYIMALMKFGEARHLKEALRGGLYMQNIEFFRRLEADPARSDPHEGLDYCGQPGRFAVEVRQEANWLKVGGIVGPILVRDGQPIGNLYCLFVLTAAHAEEYFEGRSQNLVNVDDLRLGDSVVVFLDGEEFFRRVHAATQREGLDLVYGPVEYVERHKYSGPMGPFRKFSEFTRQSEFRLLVAPEVKDPRVLDVGPLGDIAFMCPCSQLNKRLRLRQRQD